MRSPAAHFALVNHPPFEIADNIFVRFVNHDNRPEIHRSVQGFRIGWSISNWFLGH